MADIDVFPLPKKLLQLWSNVSAVTCKWPKIVHYWAILNIFSCTLGHITSYVAVFPHYKDFFFSGSTSNIAVAWLDFYETYSTSVYPTHVHFQTQPHNSAFLSFL